MRIASRTWNGALPGFVRKEVFPQLISGVMPTPVFRAVSAQ
jgi:hypothetical protein